MQTTEGTLLGGRVPYAQPAGGYRTGIEPVLLAASIPARSGQRVLEAGTGAGAGLLCLLHRVPGLSATGVERDEAMACLARRNLAAAGADATILHADVAALPPLPPFDHVFSNPPWHEPRSTRPPDSRRADATHREAGGLARWIGALAPLATRTLTLILPATLAADAMAGLRAARLRQITLYPLWPRSGLAARIVLIQAARRPDASRIAAGLVLHGAGQGYTPETEAVLRHGEALALERPPAQTT